MHADVFQPSVFEDRALANASCGAMAASREMIVRFLRACSRRFALRTLLSGRGELWPASEPSHALTSAIDIVHQLVGARRPLLAELARRSAFTLTAADSVHPRRSRPAECWSRPPSLKY